MASPTLNPGLGDRPAILAAATAAVATIATFAKSFVPFYLIGSTLIFATCVLLGIALVAISWRPLRENAGDIRDVLVVACLLYAAVVASYLLYSIHRVPITYLVGILIFHGVFLMLGFAAARAPKAVFVLL